MADGCGFRAEYEDERHHTRACVLCVSWKYLPAGARSAAFEVRVGECATMPGNNHVVYSYKDVGRVTCSDSSDRDDSR